MNKEATTLVKLSKKIELELKKISSKANFKPVIVCVDDETDYIEIIQDELKVLGVEIKGFTHAHEAIDFIKGNGWRTITIISDLKMPEIDGLMFRQAILENSTLTPFYILSAFIDKELALKGLEKKISNFIHKPVTWDELATVIESDLLNKLIEVIEDNDLLIGFIDDTKAMLEQIESFALELEENPQSMETLNSIFGIVHTIKGASGFFTPKTMHEFIHQFEDLLKQVQSQEQSVSASMINSILAAVDITRILLDEFANHHHQQHKVDDLLNKVKSQGSSPSQDKNKNKASESKSTQEEATHAPPKAKDIKVDLSILDDFLRASGEMTVIRNMLNKAVSNIEKKYPSDKDVTLISELLEELQKVNAMAQNKITEIRKVSVRHIVRSIPRAVHDVSKKLEKEIDLKISGENIRVDNSIAEVLGGSLLHLVKNSIDHGIESQEIRLQNNKPKHGTVKLNFTESSEFVHVHIEDDGGGINTKVLRRKMIEKGQKTQEEVAALSDDQVNMTIFESGMSTAEKTTDISGRGVGMSAVKESVENIGGKIHIKSRPDQGSLFTLELPVPKSVLIKNCLFVSCLARSFGIAQDQVLRLYHIGEHNYKGLIFESENGRFLKNDENHLTPLISLHSILFPQENLAEKKDLLIVIVQTREHSTYGLIVDDIIDFEDAVVKDLTHKIKALNTYSGATFLADGKVGLLLDIDGLAKLKSIRVNTKDQEETLQMASKLQEQEQNRKGWLLFKLDGQNETYAIDQDIVFRIEEIKAKKLVKKKQYNVLPYRNSILPIFNPLQIMDNKNEMMDLETIQVLIINIQDRLVGISVREILDMVSSDASVSVPLSYKKGVKGTIIINTKAVTVLDVEDCLEDYIWISGNETSTAI